MKTYTIKYRLFTTSKDGKTIDKNEHDLDYFKAENDAVLKSIVELPAEESFNLIVDGSNAVTVVEGNAPYEYKRDSRETDQRYSVTLNTALQDLRNPSSDLFKLFLKFYPENSNNALYMFAQKLVTSILKRGAISGAVAGPHTRICAKSYQPWSDPVLDYSEYTNYFTFDLPKGIWDGTIDALDPIHGDFLIDKPIEDLDKDFILSTIVPAFYFSFYFLKHQPQGVRDLFSYHLELA